MKLSLNPNDLSRVAPTKNILSLVFLRCLFDNQEKVNDFSQLIVRPVTGIRAQKIFKSSCNQFESRARKSISSAYVMCEIRTDSLRTAPRRPGKHAKQNQDKLEKVSTRRGRLDEPPTRMNRVRYVSIKYEKHTSICM